ncbi:MAG TPA: DUF2330 domain-containing protein [Gemmataceae bacterium]|nr:DUF2330 domain-containing protein [Gemmataceae bacterium]
MNLTRALCLLPPALAALLLLVPAPPAAGCAVAPRHGDYVQIADESAIIVWDAASKTEHFIRRATFSSAAHDFGFLVPTPEKPELAEAGDTAFTDLANVTAPKVITRSAPSSNGGGCGCGVMAPMAANKAAAPAGAQVEVLETKRVAGYDAAVLQADDADALAKWLKDHGYESSPALAEWMAPYVKAKWKISAFKIARDDPAPPGTGKAGAAAPAAGPAPGAGTVATTALRMTFHTERPFYPYREPTTVPPVASGPTPWQRLLRVYFVSNERVKGTVGADDRAWGEVANVRTVWAGGLTEPTRERLLGELKMAKEPAPATWWLTEFEDHSSPRPGGEDVFFSRDENQDQVERPPVVQYVSGPMPACIMCCALVLYMIVPRLLRRVRGPLAA